jgi:uncharacterized membrane protein YkvA (DUF1232 family)
MSDKPKRDLPRNLGFFRQLIEQVRLAWALLLDSRVPWLTKVIPLAAIAYVLSPIDLAPDVIPVLGQIDDLGIIMMAISIFNSIAPPEVVEEAVYRLRSPLRVRREGGETIIDVKPDRINSLQSRSERDPDSPR